MEQVEGNNKYIVMNVNNGSEKWTGKKHCYYFRLIYTFRFRKCIVLPSEPRRVCLFYYNLYGTFVLIENLFKF